MEALHRLHDYSLIVKWKLEFLQNRSRQAKMVRAILRRNSTSIFNRRVPRRLRLGYCWSISWPGVIQTQPWAGNYPCTMVHKIFLILTILGDARHSRLRITRDSWEVRGYYFWWISLVQSWFTNIRGWWTELFRVTAKCFTMFWFAPKGTLI